MRSILLPLAALALLLLLVPARAEAGCPSSGTGGCDMAAALSPSIPEALSCLTVTSDENDCVCRSTLRIQNGCSEALNAVGFQFCGEPYFTDCPTSIEPGAAGEVFMPREGSELEPGSYSAELDVMLGGANHTLVVDYEMVHVEKGGCNSGGSTGGLALSALALTGLFFRRRHRTDHVA